MPSPHFPIKRGPLEAVFTESRLLRLWTSKVRNFQKGQLLFDLYDNLDFHDQRVEEVRQICQAALAGEYNLTSRIRVSVEKSKGLCRHLSVPNCRDALVLQALSDALYLSLKKSAPSSNAYFEQKENSFSRNSLSEYGTLASWKKFQTALLGFTKVRRYVVVTDIANFYDFIGHRNLRNIISSRSDGQNEVVLDALIFCLNQLVWRAEYMPDPEMGLPQMDSDAPRILAHAFLYEADEFLEKAPHLDFARFMDDIDIGTDSIPDAKIALRDLDIILKSRGVRLNSGKTHILTSKEAAGFFWARENGVLDKAGNGLEKGAHRNRLFVELLRKRFLKQYKKHKYSYGNGEK